MSDVQRRRVARVVQVLTGLSGIATCDMVGQAGGQRTDRGQSIADGPIAGPGDMFVVCRRLVHANRREDGTARKATTVNAGAK